MISKKEIENTEINSNIRILRKAIKFAIKLCNEIDFEYNKLLAYFGVGEQKYDTKLKLLAVTWNGLTQEQQSVIKEWSSLSNKKKRAKIQDEQGIIIDSEIDKQLVIFNNVVKSFDGYSFDQIIECADYISEIEKSINPATLLYKIASVFDKEYNDNLDKPGQLFQELISIIHLATNKKFSEDDLINTDYKLLTELFIRIFLKPQDEANTSFFIEKAVSLFMKNINGLQHIKR